MLLQGKDCAEYISLAPFMSTTEQDVPKRWVNIGRVGGGVHVALPRASVKKGLSVSRNAQASGPHAVTVEVVNSGKK